MKKFYEVNDFEGMTAYFCTIASAKRAYAALKKEMIRMNFSGELEIASFQLPKISRHELMMRLLNHHEFMADRQIIKEYHRD